MVFGFCAADEKNHKHDRNRSLLFNSMGGFDDGTTDELADSRRRDAERRAAKAEFPLHSNQGSFARRSSSIQPTSNGRHIVNSLARRRGVTSPPPIRTNDGARAGPPTPSNDNNDQSTSHNASSIAPRGHSLDSTVAMAPTPPPTKKRYASPNSRPEAGSPPEMGRPPSPPSTRIMRRGLSPNNNGQATVSPTSSIRRTNTGSSRRTSSPSQEPPNLDGIMAIRRHRSPSPAARLDLLPTVNANHNTSATVLDYQSNTQAPSPLSPSKNFPFNTDKTTPVSPKISIFAILQWVAILLIVLAVAGFALVVDGRQSSNRSSGILMNGQKLASSHHRMAGHGATHLSSHDQLLDSNDDADSDEYEDDDGEDDEGEIEEGTAVNSTTGSLNANSKRLLSSRSLIASALYPITKSIYIFYRLCAGSLAAAWDGLWWVLCFGGCAKPNMESPPTGNTLVTSNVSSEEAPTDLHNESGIDAQAAAKVAKLAEDSKVARELKEAVERKANDERQALEAKAMKDAADRKAKEEADRKAAEELKAKAAKKAADEHKAKVAKEEADRKAAEKAAVEQKAEKAAEEQRIKAAEVKVSQQIAVEDDEEDDDVEYEDEDEEDEDRIPSASFTSVWLGAKNTVQSALQAIIDYISTGFVRMQSSATTLASAAGPKISSWIESLMDKLFSVFGGATTTIRHASNYSAETLEQAAFHTIAFLRAVNGFLVTAINKNIEGIHAARGRNPSVTDALIGATVAVVLTVVGVYTKGGRKLLERGRHAVSPSLQAVPSEPPIVGNSPSSPRVIQLEATPPSRFVQPFLPTAETVSASTSPARGSIIPPFVPNGGLVPPIKPAFEPTTTYAPTLYPSSVAIKEAYRNRSVAMESNTDAVYTGAILAPLDAAITSEPSIQRASSSAIGGYTSAYAGMTKRASPHSVRPYVVSTIDVEIQNLKRELDIVRAERASRSRAGSAATVHQPNGSRSPSPRAAQDQVKAAPITSSPPPSATNVFGPTSSSRNTLAVSTSLAPSSSTISGTTGTNNNTLAPNGGRSPDPSMGAKHARSLSQPQVGSDGDLAALPIMGSGPGLAIPPPSITQNPSQTLSSISASATTNTLMQFSATVTPGTLAGAAQQGTEETSVTVPNLQHVSSEEGTTSTEKEDPLINSESSPSIAVDSHSSPTKPSLPNLSTILTVESRGNSTVILHDTVADSSSAAASPRHGHSDIEGIGYGLSVVSGIERKVDESGSGGVFPRPTNTVSQATLVNLPAVSIVAAGMDTYAQNTTALDPTVKASPVKVTRHVPHAASSIDDFLHPSGAPMVVTGLSQRTYSGSDSQSHFFSYEPHFQKPQIIGADVDSKQRQAVIQQLLQLSPQKNSLAGNRQNTQNEGHPGHSDSSHPAIAKELFGYASTPSSSIRPVVTPTSSPGQSIQNEGVDFAATAVATADEQGGANPSSSKRLLVLNGNMSPLVPKQPPPAPVLPPRAQPPSGDILRAKVRPPPPAPSKDPIIGGGEDSPRHRGHPLDASENSEVVKASPFNEAFLPSIDETPDSPSTRGSNFKIIESVEVDGSPSAFFSPPKRKEKTDPSLDASPPGSISAPSSQHREITTSEVVDTPPALSAATSAHTYAYSPVTEAHSHVTIDTNAESATIAFTDSPSDAELGTHDTFPHPKAASSHLPPMSPSKKLPPPPPPAKKAPYTPAPVVVESEAPVAPPPQPAKKLPPPPPAKKSVPPPPPPPAKQSPEASEGDLIMDKDALRKAKADYGSWF